MKRRNDDGQITRAEYELRCDARSTGPGAFGTAPAAVLASRRVAVPGLGGSRRKSATALAAEVYAARVRALNAKFAAWATRQLEAEPDVPIAEAARDYLNYAEALDAQFLTEHSDVLSFGSGDCGQLAHSRDLEDERDTVVPRPRRVLSLRDKVVTRVSCGGLHNVACTAAGECYTWGCNDEGSLGRLGEDAELYLPGIVALPEPVVACAAGGSQTFAVARSGRVYGWGCYKDKEGKQWFDVADSGLPPRRKQATPLALALSGVVDVARGAETGSGRVYEPRVRSLKTRSFRL